MPRRPATHLDVILFHHLEWGPLDRYRGLEPWFDQWTASMLHLRAASTLRKPDIIYAKYNGGPLFSLGFSQEFNTPTASPDGSASEDTEVLDIPPIREMLPEDIVIHAEQDPSTIRSLKPLTLEQENKIYNWVMNPSKAKGIQEETIASFRGYQNFFLSRSKIRFLKPKGWINDKIINWRCKEYNYSSLPRFMEDFYCMEAGILEGTYVGMHPNLSKDGKHFDGDKAANRKSWLLPVCNRLHWYLYAFNLEKKDLLVLDSMYDHAFDELRKSLDKYVGKLIEDMLKIVIPTFDNKGLGFPSRYVKVPKQPNNDDCGIYVIKLLEEWKEDSELPAYNNIRRVVKDKEEIGIGYCLKQLQHKSSFIVAESFRYYTKAKQSK
ncbi:hypothetical protein PIB30_079020 [Stylosanthes scabra]|uniref:Ubiquitin-like protease family profile domain-containing protein n=1 Tax=Stylosanthes scabra TaxID=79078 RepID=A0ABU6RR83_9FABA|nr:hypothetical protein [Stylosanthes scabra]